MAYVDPLGLFLPEFGIAVIAFYGFLLLLFYKVGKMLNLF
jgi:hypothetical protein